MTHYLQDDFLHYGDSAANAAKGFIWNRGPNDNTGAYQRPARKNLYSFSFNAPGDVTAGYGKSKREDLTINAAFSSEIGKEHSLKIGGELQMFTIRSFALGNESLMALPGLIHQNEILPDGDKSKTTLDKVIINRGVNNYGYDVFGNEVTGSGILGPKKPVFAAAYIQDKIEYKDLVVNLGAPFRLLQHRQ